MSQPDLSNTLHIVSRKFEPDQNNTSWYFHTVYLSDGSVYQDYFHMPTSEGFPFPFTKENEQLIIPYVQKAYKKISDANERQEESDGKQELNVFNQ